MNIEKYRLNSKKKKKKLENKTFAILQTLLQFFRRIS